jgi:hypothetical protein
MSFYVTLPSDTRQGPTGNLKHNYTTFFTPAISIISPFEVALTDFTFSPEIKVVYGDLRLKFTIAGTPIYSESRVLEHKDKHSLSELVDELNKQAYD